MVTSTPRYGYPIIEPDDHIRAANSQAKLAADINRVSIRSESVAAGIDSKAASSVANSENAKNAAGAAHAKNLLQDIALEAQDLRLRALEALGSLTPGAVSDGTVASLVQDDESLSHEAMESAFVKRGTLVHDVRDYGAKGDNTTDDSAAFQAAIDAARVTRGRAYAYGRFRLDQPIVIDANADFGNAVVNYYGEGIAIDVRGTRLHVTTPKELWNRNKVNGEGWDSVAGSVGVRTLNTNGCYIDIPFVSNFETGLLNLGSNGGCAYNTMILGWLFNNKINQHLDTFTDTITGYTNQNTFIGGRASHHAAEGENIPGAVSVMLGGSGSGGPNNNIWLNPCWEGVGAEYTWYFYRGRFNKVYNVRNEFGNAGRFGDGASGNELTIGYESVGFDVINDEGSHSNDILKHNTQDWYNKNVRHRTVGHEYPWFSMTWGNRTLRLGTGSSEGVPLRANGPESLKVGGSFIPDTSDTYDLGSDSRRWRNMSLSRRLTLRNSLDFEVGSGTPSAPGLARVFLRTDASGKMALYVRWPSGGTSSIAEEP